jgi:hypothetical protein
MSFYLINLVITYILLLIWLIDTDLLKIKNADFIDLLSYEDKVHKFQVNKSIKVIFSNDYFKGKNMLKLM